ncbi:MAG: exosortase family protein XrtG [Lachnospiraceae bacterium]
MQWILGILIGLVWLYVLHVLTKAEILAWRFLWGSLGLFLLLMVYLRPVLTQPLAQAVSAMAGFVGDLTGTFTAYFKYGILFIETVTGAITLQMDFECSGIIEILAFLSLLLFFDVYTRYEKIFVGIIGFAYIMLSNALRVILICEMVHFGGNSAYYLAHTFVGRFFFYALSVLLYFFVFTKPQIVKMKVGVFTYDHD